MRNDCVTRALLVCATLLVLLVGFWRPAQAAPVFFGPTPYLSSLDTPFSGVTIEDFVDGLLNIPGVTASGGIFGGPPSPDCDSVDADDGFIDGNGNAGGSYYSNGEFSLTFTFDETALGSLPTQAGIVWTDVGWGGGILRLCNL